MQKGSENMNRIFKVIWSKTKNCYVVASELAKGRTKAASTGDKAKRLALAAITALMLLPVGGYSYAANISIGTATINDSAGKETTVFTGNQTAAEAVEAAVEQTVPYNSEQIGILQDAVQNVEKELAQHQSLIDNLGTDKLTLSSDNTLQKETYDSTTKTTTTTNVTGLKVAGPISANSASISGTLSAGGAVNAESVNSRGNITAVGTIAGQTVTATGTMKGKDIIGSNSIISQGTIAATGNISSQATVGAKEMVSQTNITAKNKVVGMQGVVDNTLTSGNYITAGNTVGKNIVALDTQVKANANAINTEATAREKEDARLNSEIVNTNKSLNEAATNLSKLNTAVVDGFKTLKQADENEAVARKAADEALDSRAKALEDKTEAITYDKDSKTVMVDGKLTATEGITDGTMRDGKYVKLDKYVGQNLNALDQGLQAETSARVTTDTKLVEATNGGLSLGDGNVLQTNTTTIDAATGEVTTSKTDANEIILNKVKDNQITLNENGIKVGTNSTVVNKDGVYTGGDTYSEAKAALKSDGSIKGADGKFTVDGTNGNVSTKGSLTAASGTIGNVSMSADGTMTGVKDLTASGKITADSFTDGTATMSNGSLNGVNQINATGNIVTTGNMKAHDITAEGTIKGETINGTTGTFGSLSTTGNASVGGTLTTNGITNTGNATTDMLIVNHNATVGGNLAVTGDITGKSLNVGTGDIKGGQITGTGLDVGAGTIKTTGATETGTLKTTGKAEIGGDLSVAGNTEMKGNLDVKGDLSVEGEFNAKTLSSKLDKNNYTIINGGKTQSMNLKMNAATGETQASASTFDETGSNMWAKDDDSIGKSTVTADSISQKLSNTGDNPTAYAERAMSQGTDNKYSMTDTVKDVDKTNVASQSATESSNVITDENKNTSTFRQKVDAILQEIKNADGDTLTKVEQTDTAITSQIGDGSAIKSVMNADGIANTATGKSITNDAADIINTGTNSVTNQVGSNKVVVDTTGVKSAYGDNTYTTWNAEGITNSTDGNMTNTVGGEMKTTVAGKVTEDYKSDLDTKVGGNETHYVAGNQTNTVSGDRTVNVKGTEKENFNAQVTNVKTNQKTSVGGNQTNIVGGDQQNTVSGSKTETVKGSVTEKYGSQATTVDGDQSTHVGGSQSNVVTGNQTNTISGSKTETVKGAVSETYGSQTTKVNGDQSTTVTGKQTNSITGDQVNTIGGSQTTTVTGDSSLSAKNITNTASEKITNQIGDGSAVKSEMTADGITNTAEGGTIYNKSKDILNEASGDILNFADGEIGNVATKITNITGDTTVTSDTNGTTFENKAHNTAINKGTVTKTTISGNTIETGQATMDYAEVKKDLGVHGNATVDQKLTVKGDSDLQGNANVGKNLTVNGISDLKGNVTMESNATVQKDLTVNGTTTTNKLVVNNGATVTGGTTTDTLHVTSSSTFDGAATFKDVVTMEKDLSVGGNATVAGSMTASSYKVGDKTYISESGINANNQKVVNVAAGDLSANSTDAVNGAQLYQTNERVTGVENKVNKLDSRVDKVGANAAALANLHPLEFDADSKWNIAAAVGGYKGETATAIGAFYRPNENVMVNVSSSFGTGENMYGGGISLRIGQGGNKARRNATNGLTEREKAMQKQIDSLTSRLDALLSVINPNMSKDFPDVPENHWAYEAVSRLAGNGVIQGYEDGKYHGDRTMTRYEMAEIIYNALSKGAKAEKKLVEEFKPELQAMAAQKKA